MIKINQRYLDEACRIRESYIKIIEEINEKENEISLYKERVQKLLSECDEFINNNKHISIEEAKQKLKEQLSEIDIKINKVADKLLPLFEKIEELKRESHELFISIKDKYPELSEEEIQIQVLKSLKK